MTPEEEKALTENQLATPAQTISSVDKPITGIFIEDIEHLFKHVTSVPTHTPRRWADQFVLYDDSSKKRYYIWINGSWEAFYGDDEVDLTGLLTGGQKTDLTDGGDSTLHYHATDRDSANFTGTNWADLTDGDITTLHSHSTDTDFFSKYFHFMSFESLDGFGVTTDFGASIAVYPPGTRLQTGATSSNHCFAYNNGIFRNLIASGKVIIVEWTTLYWGATTDQLAFLTISTSLTDPPAESHNSFGFRISSGASIFATNGNGSNSTVTDTTDDVSTGPFIRLRAVYTVGTDIKYYVNDTLRATHTTNLPSNGDNRAILYLKAEAAANKELHLGRVLITRTY